MLIGSGESRESEVRSQEYNPALDDFLGLQTQYYRLYNRSFTIFLVQLFIGKFVI